jgi:hypothetical protein
LIPDGLLATVPEPPPESVTDSILVVGFFLKVAFTLVSAEIVNWHVPVPLHPSPDQSVKLDPAEADADRVTSEPTVKGTAHWLVLALQLMPAGLLVTCPVPVPASATVRDATSAVKVADTLSAALIVMVQAPVHAPPHPAKVDPAAAEAVKITCVPD